MLRYTHERRQNTWNPPGSAKNLILWYIKIILRFPNWSINLQQLEQVSPTGGCIDRVCLLVRILHQLVSFAGARTEMQFIFETVYKNWSPVPIAELSKCSACGISCKGVIFLPVPNFTAICQKLQQQTNPKHCMILSQMKVKKSCGWGGSCFPFGPWAVKLGKVIFLA